MYKKVYSSGGREVSIVRAETFEEWKELVSQGYVVATTQEQRRAWDLMPTDDLPCLPSEQVVELAFLAPEDPLLQEIDDFNPVLNRDVPPEVENGECIEGNDGRYYRLSDDGELVFDDEGNPVEDERFAGARHRAFAAEAAL